MSYLEFKDIPITTMTLVVTLNTEISRILAFNILPITRIPLPDQKRRSKKYKLPIHDEAGCILSMRFNGYTRGINRSYQNSYLKNSISIDISAEEKNINVKLSKHKIHMCGAKSLEQGRRTAQFIVDHLIRVQAELDYMNEDTEDRDNALKWIKSHIKGEKVKRPVYKFEQIVYAKEDRVVLKNKRKQQKEQLNKMIDVGLSSSDVEGFTRGQMLLSDLLAMETDSDVETNKHEDEIILTKKVLIEEKDDNYIIQPKNIPPGIDARIVNLLLRQTDDYKYYSDLVQELDWITTQSKLYDEVPRIINIQKAMVNYNYDLGFDINRGELTKRIHMYNEFTAIYDNMVGHNVTISLPYKTQSTDICRKRDTKLIKFIVYHSGKVTQSGPSEELNEEAYKKFIETIDIIRPHVAKQKTDV
jgi:hypothetical protein